MKCGMTQCCEVGEDYRTGGFSSGWLETKGKVDILSVYILCVIAQKLREYKITGAVIFELPHNDIEEEMLEKPPYSWGKSEFLLGEITLWLDFRAIISVFVPKPKAQELFCKIVDELEKLQGKEKTKIKCIDLAAKYRKDTKQNSTALLKNSRSSIEV